MTQRSPADSIPLDGLVRQVQRSTPTRGQTLLRLIRRQPVGAAALLFLIILAFAGIFAELVATRDPTAQTIRDSLKPPGFYSERLRITYWLGTDALGRDVYSRLVHGARISLAVGVLAVTIGTVGGLLLGMFSGYRGGRIDMVIQRVMDAKQAIPTLIFAMLLVAVLGKDLKVTALAIGITQIPRANRIIRSNVLSVIQEQYLEAAKTMGARESRIIFQHIMPNVMAVTLIVFSTSIGAAIVTESTLSFLGSRRPRRTPPGAGC